MKKSVVNYREFRFSKLNTPEFSHLKYLFGWVVYFTLYFITENLISPERCHVIYSPLDDMIPFMEIFVIPYVLWYGLIVFSLTYFARYNIDSFKKLQCFIMITQAVAMVIYIVYPSKQELRPTEFANQNILTDIIGFLYSFDTNTGVFPSLHVAYSVGIASVWLKEKDASLVLRIIIAVFCFLVCISTAFIKQHSILDAFGAIPVCILAEAVLYGKYWRDIFKPKRQTT